jgi:hypothetical protein
MSHPHPVETYLADLYHTRSTGAGTAETSFYPALANLLNAAGHALRPRVRCVMNLRNQGAGMPDGGLFTPDQYQRGADEPTAGQPPARGAVECKPVADDAWLAAKTEQVSRYGGKYRQVLVTNYRDFLLLGADDAGRPVVRETFRIAPSAAAFWAMRNVSRSGSRRMGTGCWTTSSGSCCTPPRWPTRKT